jgi:purine-binding chemotaxis protein CheW
MKNEEFTPAEHEPAEVGTTAGWAIPAEEWALTPEKSKEILKARAQALARRPEEEESGIQWIEIVEFLLANERYGIESSYIGEVQPLRELTPLPCTPPFVLGIINVRGNIFSVIDLRKFFDLPQKGLTDMTKVIVLQDGTMEFGILADAVLGSRRIPLRDLQPPLPTMAEIHADYLKGVTAERLVVLDGGRILSDRTIIVHDEV